MFHAEKIEHKVALSPEENHHEEDDNSWSKCCILTKLKLGIINTRVIF